MMQSTFIADDDNEFISDQAVVQCSCMGHCSYLTVFNVINSSSVKGIFFNILSPYKDKFNKLAKFTNEFILNRDELSEFISAFESCRTSPVSFYSANNYMLIVKKYEDKQDDLYQIMIYNNRQKRKTKKCFFDITLSGKMFDKFINTLKEWVK